MIYYYCIFFLRYDMSSCKNRCVCRLASYKLVVYKRCNVETGGAAAPMRRVSHVSRVALAARAPPCRPQLLARRPRPVSKVASPHS